MSEINFSVADILGPGVEANWDSSLIARCRKAWGKPLRDLSRGELATFLQQHIAVEHVLPVAKQKIENGIDDGTELFDGELLSAIEQARRTIQ